MTGRCVGFTWAPWACGNSYVLVRAATLVGLATLVTRLNEGIGGIEKWATPRTFLVLVGLDANLGNYREALLRYPSC